MVSRSLPLQPGSSEPANHAEVEALLRRVPELAFEPELQGCVPVRDPDVSVTPNEVDVRADETYLAALERGLQELQARAEGERNGGVLFLARTLRHFLRGPIRPCEHPLVVALFVRGDARSGRHPDTPAAIASVMDGWEAAPPGT